MNSRIVTTVQQWLAMMHIKLPATYLRQRLMSHPDFPSALSITSLLDDLGVKSHVLQIDGGQWSEMPVPFLAFVDPGEFIIISDNKKEDSLSKLKNRWNGIVIVAEKPAVLVQSPALENARRSSRTSSIKWTLFIGVTILLAAFAVWNSGVLYQLILFLAVCGVVVCGLIVLHESGIETRLSQHICFIGKVADCDAVLRTKASTLLLNIKLSDIGMAFFSGIIFIVLLCLFAASEFQSASLQFIYIICFTSIPFTLFSIYYQWRFVKKWCTSCLTVVAILWMMTIIQFFQRETFPGQINSIHFMVVSGLFILPGAAWLIVRDLLNYRQELLEANIELQRISRSPELFQTYIFTQKNIEAAPWLWDFQIGNPHAQCQLIVVSSYFCGPCVETYALLQQLLARHKDRFGITIRFLTSKKEKKGDDQTNINQHMLQYALATENFLKYPEKIGEMLGSWYHLMDFEKFRALYPVRKEIDTHDILTTQRNWFKLADIQYTPTVFINGYRLRSPYSQTDLIEFSELLLELFPENELEPTACEHN